MKCKIFVIASASMDEVDRIEKEINEFLRNVNVGFLAQSGPRGGSVITILYENRPAARSKFPS